MFFFIYVAKFAFDADSNISLINTKNFRIILFGLAVYTVAITLIGATWGQVIRVKHESIRPRDILYVYFISGIGKYLPGNIGHQLGRVYILHKQSGTPRDWIVISLFIEFGLAIVSALLLSMPYLILYLEPHSTTLDSIKYAIIITIIILILGFILFKINQHLQFFKHTAEINLIWSNRNKLLGCLFSMCFSFILMSFVFGIFAYYFIDKNLFTPFFLAFPLSWILGYVTPGAPAGIGTREIAMLTILHNMAPTSLVSQIAILMRVVTFSSDIILYFIGLLIIGRSREQKK